MGTARGRASFVRRGRCRRRRSRLGVGAHAPVAPSRRGGRPRPARRRVRLLDARRLGGASGSTCDRGWIDVVGRHRRRRSDVGSLRCASARPSRQWPLCRPRAVGGTARRCRRARARPARRVPRDPEAPGHCRGLGARFLSPRRARLGEALGVAGRRMAARPARRAPRASRGGSNAPRAHHGAGRRSALRHPARGPPPCRRYVHRGRLPHARAVAHPRGVRRPPRDRVRCSRCALPPRRRPPSPTGGDGLPRGMCVRDHDGSSDVGPARTGHGGDRVGSGDRRQARGPDRVARGRRRAHRRTRSASRLRRRLHAVGARGRRSRRLRRTRDGVVRGRRTSTIPRIQYDPRAHDRGATRDVAGRVVAIPYVLDTRADREPGRAPADPTRALPWARGLAPAARVSRARAGCVPYRGCGPRHRCSPDRAARDPAARSRARCGERAAVTARRRRPRVVVAALAPTVRAEEGTTRAGCRPPAARVPGRRLAHDRGDDAHGSRRRSG